MTIRGQVTGHALGSREMAILLAVADAGSLRRAAAHLGVSATAVSKAVRLAEDRLGAAIFDRTASGLVPTTSGCAMIESGRAALHALSAAEQTFRDVAGQPSGRVRIGCGPVPALGVARLVLPEVKRRWPAVRLSVELGAAADLVHAMGKGVFDIALCHVDGIIVPPGIQQHHLQSLRSVVLVRHGHPLLASVPADPAAVAGYALASVAPSPGFLVWFHAQTGANPEFGLVGPDFDMLAEVVARSDLLLMASHFLSDSLTRVHGLTELSVRWEDFRLDVQCLLATRSASAAIHAVAALIRETLTVMEE